MAPFSGEKKYFFEIETIFLAFRINHYSFLNFDAFKTLKKTAQHRQLVFVKTRMISVSSLSYGNIFPVEIVLSNQFTDHFWGSASRIFGSVEKKSYAYLTCIYVSEKAKINLFENWKMLNRFQIRFEFCKTFAGLRFRNENAI